MNCDNCTWLRAEMSAQRAAGFSSLLFGLLAGASIGASAASLVWYYLSGR